MRGSIAILLLAAIAAFAGAYSGTASPYGAYDMGGNVFQCNEALISGSARGLRGGSFIGDSSYLSSNRNDDGWAFEDGFSAVGFRLADIPGVPEPSTLVLAAVGLAGLIVWGRRRRKR